MPSEPSSDQSYFPVPAIEELPEKLQSLFGKAKERLGFIPQVFRVYAHRPERFSAWFAHFSQVMEPTEDLTAADREMIAVVVSSANRCTYCVVSHGHDLRQALGDVVMADRIMVNWRSAGLNERDYAICDFAERLAREPETVGPDDLSQLAKAGLPDEAIWDVVELVSMYSFTNRMSSALGMMPNPEYHVLGREER